MSPWAWLGFIVVAVVVVALVAFVLAAIWSGAREATTKSGGACARCGLPYGDPWPPKGREASL